MDTGHDGIDSSDPPSCPGAAVRVHPGKLDRGCATEPATHGRNRSATVHPGVRRRYHRLACSRWHSQALRAWEDIAIGWACRSGKAWTTDPPYRETKAQLNRGGWQGALAVEMQAAS